MTMRERMARAMHERPRNGIALAKKPPPPWDDLHEPMRTMYRRFADAALEAMREPSAAMVGEGFEAIRMEEKWPECIAKIYRAMIDAALSEPQAPTKWPPKVQSASAPCA